MVKQELVEKLKSAKVKRDRRWVYNLVAWALENHTRDIVDFQRRITSTVHYAKGRYQEYWDNPRVKEQHKKSDLKCKLKNKKHIERSKKYNTELKLAYNLFKSGQLSKKSTREVEDAIKISKTKFKGNN